MIKRTIAVTALVFCVSWAQAAQDTLAPIDNPAGKALLEDLSPAYRDAASKYLNSFLANPKNAADLQKQIQEGISDELRGTYYWEWFAFGGIFIRPGGRDFMMRRLEKEPDGAIRAVILRIAGEAQYRAAWLPEGTLTSEEIGLITRHAASDPDPEAAAAAITALHDVHVAQEGEILAERRKLGDATPLSDLYADRYSWFGRALRNPRFNYTPPPVFGAAPAKKSIRVLAFGDFGTGSNEQIKDAEAMRTYHKQHPFDFGLALGDNFYNEGLNSPSNPRWQSQWENLYGPMGIKFYPVFGNHEYTDPDSPAAEIAYSARSTTWMFPAAYYTFTAGEAQFFAIDNIRLTDEELAWLDDALRKSTAKWKIVYGHYHIYSATRGDNDQKQDDLIGRLLPILEKNHVQVYLNGHDHNMQEARTESSVHFFTCGAGGAMLYDLKSTYKHTVFGEKQFGFTVIEADAQHLDVIFVDMTGKEIYRSHISG